jgi:alpha-1,3-rhamnosyl/mannosyltransferase
MAESPMTLHVGVSAWLLDAPSGANERLLQLLAHAAPLLAATERVTVLHGPGFEPPFAHAQVAWRDVAIPAAPTWRRALAERRHLPALVRSLGLTVLDHGLLPAPAVPCPLVLTLHDLRDADGHGRRSPWLARLVVRRACRRAARVIVPSAFTLQRLRACVPGARADVVVNGAPAVPALPPAPGGPLLHVGHLEPRKNLAVLLRALALLPEAERPQLWLAGADAGSGRSLRALASSLGVREHVRFLGVVPADTLRRCYASARAVVVPSVYEGFGLCALDGLAHGRPVLVAAAGALPEVVADAGRVLPPGDAAAWAQAIADAGAQSGSDGGAAAARRERAAAFSWARAAEQLVAIWRSLARGPQ